jgi:hypothetical protein
MINNKLTNEIVVLSGPKFQSSGLRSEWTERYGKIQKLARLITDGDYPRIRIGDTACVVFLFRYLQAGRE